jgi:AraC-like DNA-binding protein
MPGFTFFKPHPAVADIVETIWDADLPDPNLVGAIAIKLLPTVSPVLCVHYRPPTATNQWANTHHRQRLAGIQTAAITLRPRGPLGCVVAHLKPDAASLLMGGRMDEFTDANIGVCDVLSPTRASELEEMLAEAADASERAERMQAFLLAQVREATPDLIVRQAVLLLRRNPNLSVRQVAKSLDISERQLERRFYAGVGTNLKQFARIVRMGKVVTARRRGADWADIAYACGFTDQAHLVNDFKSMAQSPPEAFFRTASVAECQSLNASLAAVSDFCNTFVV